VVEHGDQGCDLGSQKGIFETVSVCFDRICELAPRDLCRKFPAWLLSHEASFVRSSRACGPPYRFMDRLQALRVRIGGLGLKVRCVRGSPGIMRPADAVALSIGRRSRFFRTLQRTQGSVCACGARLNLRGRRRWRAPDRSPGCETQVAGCRSMTSWIQGKRCDVFGRRGRRGFLPTLTATAVVIDEDERWHLGGAQLPRRNFRDLLFRNLGSGGPGIIRVAIRIDSGGARFARSRFRVEGRFISGVPKSTRTTPISLGTSRSRGREMGSSSSRGAHLHVVRPLIRGRR